MVRGVRHSVRSFTEIPPSFSSLWAAVARMHINALSILDVSILTRATHGLLS